MGKIHKHFPDMYPTRNTNQVNILKQLNNVKVSKDKKWLYSFVEYIIKRKDNLNYHNLQIRINMIHKQSQGYFKDYYNNMTPKKKRAKVTKDLQRQTERRHREKINLKQTEMRRIYQLYKEGKLSIKSTNNIDKDDNMITLRKKLERL